MGPIFSNRIFSKVIGIADEAITPPRLRLTFCSCRKCSDSGFLPGHELPYRWQHQHGEYRREEQSQPDIFPIPIAVSEGIQQDRAAERTVNDDSQPPHPFPAEPQPCSYQTIQQRAPRRSCCADVEPLYRVAALGHDSRLQYLMQDQPESDGASPGK